MKNKNAIFLQTSAKNGVGIEEAFKKILEKIDSMEENDDFFKREREGTRKIKSSSMKKNKKGGKKKICC